MQLDLTQMVGLAAFGTCAVLAALAARVDPRQRIAWAALAALHALLAIEVSLGLRYRFHAIADAVLSAHGAYAGRTPWQLGLLAVVVAGTLAIATVVARTARLRGRALSAFSGSAVLLGLFLVEVVSLHAVDAQLYASIGPVEAIGWMWICGCAVVGASAAAVLSAGWVLAADRQDVSAPDRP